MSIKWYSRSLALGLLLAAAAPVAAQRPKLTGGADSKPAPLETVAMMMTDVTRDLNHLSTSAPTQQKEENVVGQLDELIKQLEKECDCCKGSKSKRNPKKPALESKLRTGPGGDADLHAAKRGGKDWAGLPAHQRDRILQSMAEGFPADYQRILERYYKRLAEEKTQAAEAETGRPAAKPAAKK